MATIRTDVFAVILNHKGEEYVLSNDGGHGPLSTGTDEWCERYKKGLGKLMSKERALSVLKDPNVGYGKAPMPSTRTMYRILLSEEAMAFTDPADIRAEEEYKKSQALLKLTPEERKLLGLEAKQ